MHWSVIPIGGAIALAICAGVAVHFGGTTATLCDPLTVLPWLRC